MATDSMGVSDELVVELNGQRTGQLPPIPARPTSDSLKPEWVAYAVALGMHPDAAGEMTVVELVDVTIRLGG
jgi:hypothetical protein